MDTSRFVSRRKALMAALPGEALLILSNRPTPRNYAANTYAFRQNSHFLYFTGLKAPDLALLLTPDGRETLYGAPPQEDEPVWSGASPSLEAQAAEAGLTQVAPQTELPTALARLGKVHFTAPYRAAERLWLAELLGTTPDEVPTRASLPLARAIVALRAVKDEDEVAEIEEALSITARMFESARPLIHPGSSEAAVRAAMLGVAALYDRALAYEPICSVRGEILHNPQCRHRLDSGALLLIDMGAESPNHYASDITRCYPVDARFNSRQREIYILVWRVQEAIIAKAKPGVSYRELHLLASRVFIEGLKQLGLMRGDGQEALAAGAHALFFPHGLGHMLGLDVHDMEDLGDLVGYEEGQTRSPQFGLSYLRFARELRPGFVLTVEPGLYFNPELIARWRAARLHESFINYERLEAYAGFGGVRVEDDILITQDGARVLGPGIPKTPEALEG